MAHPSVPVIYTRKDYLNGACSHRTYYSQLVSPALVQQVKNYFGMDALISPKNDGAFNHLALKKWDALAYNVQMPKKADWDMLGDFPTQAGLVCILKTAAHIAVEQERK